MYEKFVYNCEAVVTHQCTFSNTSTSQNNKFVFSHRLRSDAPRDLSKIKSPINRTHKEKYPYFNSSTLLDLGNNYSQGH